jgi:hypothetical protein
MTAQAARSDSTKTQRPFDPHRARAREEIEHARVLDRPDERERRLPHAVAGGARDDTAWCRDAMTFAGARDDAHRRPLVLAEVLGTAEQEIDLLGEQPLVYELARRLAGSADELLVAAEADEAQVRES